MYFMFKLNTVLSPSSLVLQLSVQQKSVSSILRGLARTLQSNSFLLTSPLLIAELHTEVVHGLFVEPKLSGKPFLCVDVGMSEVLNSKHGCADFISMYYLDSPFCLHFRFTMELSIVTLLKVPFVLSLSIHLLEASWTT